MWGGRGEGRIERARAHAEEDARDFRHSRARSTTGTTPRSPLFAIGDPQAPIEKFLAILDAHGLLDEDGRIRSDARLISMGDHFDFGRRRDRGEAAESGLMLLAYLAAHPADQVIVLVGNHDIARVSDLAAFDRESFRSAQAEADRAYSAGTTNREREARLLECHPQIPTAEILSRDYATFTVEQRALVEHLLRSGRARLAFAERPDLLFVHAGVTIDDLALVGTEGEEMRDAIRVASRLNAFLEAAVSRWKDGPLDLVPLHLPGSAETGEGRGILYHRPSHPSKSRPEMFDGPPRRRFDPRTIPLGMTQVIGHVRDGKCRDLLAEWVVDQGAIDGPLRHLVTDGAGVRYARGRPPATPGAGILLFIDGGMSHAKAGRYDILDAGGGPGPARRRASPEDPLC